MVLLKFTASVCVQSETNWITCIMCRELGRLAIPPSRCTGNNIINLPKGTNSINISVNCKRLSLLGRSVCDFSKQIPQSVNTFLHILIMALPIKKIYIAGFFE